jgi:hypothetical protein
MESNFQPKQIQRNKLGLLPNYFKKIGIVVMILAFLPAVLIKATGIEIFQMQKESLKLLTMNSFILGLLFFAWSKDRIENNRTIALRLKSIAFAFIWTILVVLIEPLTDLLFSDQFADLTPRGLVFSMLLVYLFLYFLQRRTVK